LRLAEEGADLAISYRFHTKEAEEVVAGIGSFGRRGLLRPTRETKLFLAIGVLAAN
jgi:hypothetical protein